MSCASNNTRLIQEPTAFVSASCVCWSYSRSQHCIGSVLDPGTDVMAELPKLRPHLPPELVVTSLTIVGRPQ